MAGAAVIGFLLLVGLALRWSGKGQAHLTSPRVATQHSNGVGLLLAIAIIMILAILLGS